MSANSHLMLRVADLTLHSMNGTLDEQGFRQLEELLENNPRAVDYYMEILWIHVGLNSMEGISCLQGSENMYDQDLWQALLQEEKTAPAIEISHEEPRRELIRKVVYPPREKRKVTKLNLFFLAINAAAVLLIALFLRFAPSHPIEVATLSDSMNAKWAANDSLMLKGARLVNNDEKLILREGLVELTFDNQTRAVIEAPAEFQILAEDRIGLNYGKVYAIVPNGAIGFSVYTDNAKVIDLGTEFGVEVNSRGDTYLHVLKGKTTLIAGEESHAISMEVSKDSAKKVSGATMTISDVSCDEHLFARAIDSKNNVVWRQQPTLDLADVVRGGNGQGTGHSSVRLRPTKGLTKEESYGFSTEKGYRPIPELPFIDGIFVPDGHARQIITSRGDVFAECPPTSGIFDVDLFANPSPGLLKTELRDGTIQFDGEVYADGGRPCILMHSNLGVTFDLEAIRRSYQGSVTHFVSRVGIADLHEACPCNADFWVLVDGQLRYSLRQYKAKGVLNDVSVEIKDTDRFLTLVTTDGGDPDYPEKGFYARAISCDWCVFTEPVLVLE